MLDRATLRQLLGLPAAPPPLTGVTTEALPGPIRAETWQLQRGATVLPATFLAPDGPGPHPALLYCHAHGNAWQIGRKELLEGRPAFPEGPYGPALAARGIASLCVDMPGHGDRITDGAEAALAKAALWQGQTLMGKMLTDLQTGLDALAGDPRIDAARIGTLGLSMGGTHAYWLAALDSRLTCAVHLCVFANIAPLIATGAHDLHGAYMTVPGLLRAGDMGDVAALIAPRPQFIGLGSTDPLTPEAARTPALARVTEAYTETPDALCLHLSESAGHVETPAMRHAVLEFLASAL